MALSLYTITGGFLALLGLGVTILFWIPGVVHHGKLREMLGPRFPLMYIVYIANGPLLPFLGLFLVFWFG